MKEMFHENLRCNTENKIKLETAIGIIEEYQLEGYKL